MEIAAKQIHQTAAKVYAGGGYPYPRDDLRCLEDEVRSFLAAGYTRLKIKIGATDLAADRRRIERVLTLLPDARNLAVDAMNSYSPQQCLAATAALAPYGLGWFEDICDPLDLPLQADVAARYAPPIAAGEALFSLAEAKLLDRCGGLRADRDVLVFDPVHSYGLPLVFAKLKRSERMPFAGTVTSVALSCAGFGLSVIVNGDDVAGPVIVAPAALGNLTLFHVMRVGGVHSMSIDVMFSASGALFVRSSCS